jgi:hypothetical protein
VISSSDEQVVIALRVAAHKIVVPPESRWVRERRSFRAEWMMAMLAILALVAIVAALRGEPRTVPGSVSHTVPPSETPAASASGPVTFDLYDDAPWVTARAKAAPDFVVLRPTWLPRTPDAASKCEINLLRLGEDTSSEEYHVWYVSTGVSPCMLMFGAHRDVNWGGDLPNASPAPLATFVARGSVVYIRERDPSHLLLLWQENGAIYEVIAQGYELSDVVRAVHTLEPVR